MTVRKSRPTLTWHCVYTHWGEETRAAGSLEAKGFETYLPRTCTETYSKGLIKRKWEVLFPRYLFVQLDLSTEGWERANFCPGVSRLMGPASGKPFIVPLTVMERINRECGGWRAEIILPAKIPERVEEGDYTKIVAGPFSSFEGICKKSKTDRVKILFKVFGRENEIWLDRGAVEKVA